MGCEILTKELAEEGSLENLFVTGQTSMPRVTLAMCVTTAAVRRSHEGGRSSLLLCCETGLSTRAATQFTTAATRLSHEGVAAQGHSQEISMHLAALTAGEFYCQLIVSCCNLQS